MLKISEVTKIYDRKNKAIDDLSCTIEDGTFCVIIGPSGCGKTTLLRVIAGLEKCDQGQIWIDDTCINELRPYERNVAMVFQDAALFAHMTCYHNIAYGNHSWQESKQLRKKIEDIAKMLGIADLLDRYPNSLSGGQKQRVAIARALCKPSKLILMDEPFSNLDAQLKYELADEVKTLQQKLQKTIIYVTHEQKEAFALADKLIVMDQGKIMQIGKPYEVYHHPYNAFVARFFGDINILDAKITNESLFVDEVEICLVPGMEDQSCTIGIRPEDIQITGRIKVERLNVSDRGSYYLTKVKMGKRIIIVKTSTDGKFDEITFIKEKIIFLK
ncbi:MAG: ABC transporter ATP-binding protein [Erysipelotrichaceae bacterium]|nr:ABC transporter ATP-binding protein [Erysipelotrichaceae bacterium]MDY5251517.1 ABC transporter ATP-binding protein [Erysipelotrichaceae bacterium]